MDGVSKLVPPEFLAAIMAALAMLASYSNSGPGETPTPTTTAESPASGTPTPSETVPSAAQTALPTTAPRPSAPTPSTATPTVAPDVSSDPKVSAVTSLTNNERQKAGCSPVKLDTRLNQAAVAHSDDMAKRNYFDHNSPEGTTPANRVTKTGYDWKSTGENIAYGYKTPEAVMNGWMNSEGHRKNILNCSWLDMGIGIVVDTDGTIYWTQEFARPDQTSRS